MPTKHSCLAIAVALGLVAPLAREIRADEAPGADLSSTPGKGALVYVIRGGGGYFPNLHKIADKNFRSRGLQVVDYRVDHIKRATDEIVEAHRAGRLPHGVLIVGYSAGGAASIRVADQLREAGIPIRLLVLIETIRPDLPIPSNVEGCFNLYHANVVVGPVKASSPKTKLYNCRARRDAGFGPEYGHFRLPWVDGVHEMIADEIINAIEGGAPGGTIPARKARSKSQPRSTPAPAPPAAPPFPPNPFRR